MARLKTADTPSGKRKRSELGERNPEGFSKSKSRRSSQDTKTLDHVRRLEEAIQESQKNFNEIATLLSLADEELDAVESDFAAIVALCRVFCRLVAEGWTRKVKSASKNECYITDWLNERRMEYRDILKVLLSKNDQGCQHLAIALGMRLVQEELNGTTSNSESVWRNGCFPDMVRSVLQAPEGDAISRTFVEKYAQPFDDVRHWTFIIMRALIDREGGSEDRTRSVSNSLTTLSLINVEHVQNRKHSNLLCKTTSKNIDSSSHRKHAQQAWLAIMRSSLSKSQRQKILNIMSARILPWFHKPEMLMDFLVDSFNEGGATSLLSLSGLFCLMQERNLDYPDFYTKLYSLLDHQVLHSKHRSRFFRSLDIFMSSTHLSASLVASFIKRLARLAIHAPPAAIVAIIPWTYNLLKTHPSCTFMLHREERCQEEKDYNAEFGAEDAFSMDERNPYDTGAIDSCLWELETLQSHYHPNVASLARILSQQFTKPRYNLEDFLDHSYHGLVDMELGKEMKREAVVEFQIPKRVFTGSDGDALEPMMNSFLAGS